MDNRNKEIKEVLIERLMYYMFEDETIKNKLINWLIEEKQMMNERIEDILYISNTCNKDLNEADLQDINWCRKMIDYVYKFIDDIERGYKE